MLSQAGLQGVKNIVAVFSCKGGVGKSSVAVNVAGRLSAHHGFKTGVLDADVYGSALPYFAKTKDYDPVSNLGPNELVPFKYRGMKLMSVGYLKPGEAIAHRGPIVSGMIRQMLHKTHWGDLDYLVIDFPPGTGDIPLTLAQECKVGTLVMVTTSHPLALADCDKGVQLLKKTGINPAILVNNMSTHICENCSHESELFKTVDRVNKSGKPDSGADPGIHSDIGIAQKHAIPYSCNLPFDYRLTLPGPFAMQPSQDSAHCATIQRLDELAACIHDHSVRNQSGVQFGYNVDSANGTVTLGGLQSTKTADIQLKISDLRAKVTNLNEGQESSPLDQSIPVHFSVAPPEQIIVHWNSRRKSHLAVSDLMSLGT